MGGTTARLLEILLQEGDARERSAGGDTAPLFMGNKTNWVTSVSTYASPHNGAALVDILGDGFVAFLQTFIIAFAALAGNTFIDEIYDFQLEHWGLDREDGEGLVEYVTRIFQSPVFDSSNQDTSVFDLSPNGAMALQQRGKQAYPNTYYFAYNTEYTTTNLLDCAFLSSDCSQVGRPLMWLPFQPTAALIGSRRNSPEGHRANDGLVSEETGKCPTLAYNTDPSRSCPKFAGQWFPGTWLWEKAEYDHLEVIGWSLRGAPAREIFREHAQRLRGIQK
jgi:triacylglycerol lipase